VATPSIRYDTRDSFIHTKKGIFSSLSVDISKGLSNALDDFLKYRFDFRYYLTPLRRLTLAWLGRAGYIDPFNEEGAVPDDQLFFLGGISDVRGFDENLLRFDRNGDPVGGRTALVGSLEARIDLGLNLELTAFYDVGRLTDTFVDAGVSDPLRASVGLGLRYMTPIGPIGFLYGRKLHPEEGESSGRFHFSVGYTF
jgi:outer membrane protein insertion porin family